MWAGVGAKARASLQPAGGSRFTSSVICCRPLAECTSRQGLAEAHMPTKPCNANSSFRGNPPSSQPAAAPKAAIHSRTAGVRTNAAGAEAGDLRRLGAPDRVAADPAVGAGRVVHGGDAAAVGAPSPVAGAVGAAGHGAVVAVLCAACARTRAQLNRSASGDGSLRKRCQEGRCAVTEMLQRAILHLSPSTHWWYHSLWRWQKAPLGQAMPPGNGASTHVKLAQLPPRPPHCASNSQPL